MNTTYDPNIIDIPIITGVKKEESIVEPTFHEINDVRTPAEFRGKKTDD